MNSVELKELDYSLEGIKLGFESIDNLTKLYDNIKTCNYILVPSRVTKTINIALEHTYKTNKLENYTSLSLENNEDTTIFDKILSTIKSIWKKIVETWNYIWDKIISFFTGGSNKINSINQDIERREKGIKTLDTIPNNKEFKVEDNKSKIEIQSITEVLNYLNKELKDVDQIELVKDGLTNIRTTLASNIINLKHVYELTDKIIRTDEIKNSKSAEEIDSKLYLIFSSTLIPEVKNTRDLDSILNDDDIDVIKSILPYDNITIDEKKSKVSRGYIKGGCVYFCLIKGSDEEHGNFECIAINRKSEASDHCDLYYLTYSGLTEINQILKDEMKNFESFFSNYNDFYKKIKNTHNSIKKEIDIFINDKNIVSDNDPDNFKAKFEILRNITHSMLRYGLELTKGVGMYQDTLSYYNKLLDINYSYYQKDIKKGS